MTKRPPRISDESRAKRRPLPPVVLLQTGVASKQSTTRLLANKPINTTKGST